MLRFRCAAALVVAFVFSAATGSSALPDPVAAAIARFTSVIEQSGSRGEIWKDAAGAVRPLLAAAAAASASGRRLLAIERLSRAWPEIEAAEFTASHSKAELSDIHFVETEWRKNAALRDVTVPPIEPAVLRGLAEAALLESRGYYDASLDYGRNTAPQAALYYVGEAKGLQAFAKFAQSLSRRDARKAPPLRSLAGELEALQHELLTMYRPPASIERHPEFIRASSTLKEARELDAAGLRYGALVRYLQAALYGGRFASLQSDDAIRARLAEAKSRLAKSATDDSVARLFIETAEADLESPDRHLVANAVASSALPRYFEAIAPSAATRATPKPLATVTLVRWPYT